MAQYIVKRGDTLWEIAGTQVGDSTRWSEVARLNQLRPPYLIVTGQTLLLPAKAQRSPVATPQRWPGLAAARPGARAAARPEEAGAGALPARAFLFVLADEVLPSGKLVRKVLQNPMTIAEVMAANPEVYGLRPLKPASTVSIGEHALCNTNSRFTSASTLPHGAPNMNGRPVYIDIAKARAAGVTIHSSEEIIADLYRLAQGNPQLKGRVDRLASVIRNVEQEVLLEGNVPRGAIKSGRAMAMTRGLRFVSVVGVAFTAHDVGNATVRSVEEKSVAPLAAEGLRQAGGWGMGWLGMKAGCAAGALVGIETGPGAILACGVGGLVFGTAGYLGADWLADLISEN